MNKCGILCAEYDYTPVKSQRKSTKVNMIVARNLFTQMHIPLIPSIMLLIVKYGVNTFSRHRPHFLLVETSVNICYVVLCCAVKMVYKSFIFSFGFHSIWICLCNVRRRCALCTVYDALWWQQNEARERERKNAQNKAYKTLQCLRIYTPANFSLMILIRQGKYAKS